MFLIHAYTPLHLMQIKTLLKKIVRNSKYVLVVPKRFSGALGEYDFKPTQVITYDNLDASSFSKTYFQGRGSRILKDIGKVEHLLVPDVAYSFSNFIVSYFKAKNPNLNVQFFFDGTLSMVNTPITKTDKLKDILKYSISLILSDVNYIKRKVQLNGADLDLCSSQLSVIDNPSLLYRDKVQVIPDLINSPTCFKAENNVLIFIVQDANVIMPEYLVIYNKTIAFVKEKYPDYEIRILLRNREHRYLVKEQVVIERDFVGESAEFVISRLSPKVVISHYSTVLINLSLADYKGEIVSFCMSEFNHLVGEKPQVTAEVSLIHDSLGIRTF